MKKGVKSKKQSDLITDVGSLIKFLSKLKPETKIKEVHHIYHLVKEPETEQKSFL